MSTNEKRKQVGVDHPPLPHHDPHPREGAAALGLEDDCPPQATPNIASSPNTSTNKSKHIWEGHDKIYFRDGSWAFSMNRPNWLNALLTGGLVLCGGVEALLFLKTGVINPVAISSQFVFSKFIVLKLFFSIVGSSMLFQSIFDYFCPSFYAETRAVRYHKPGYLKSFLGGALLGIGTATLGSGNTLSPAFIAGGVPNSIYILVGLLAGSLIYRTLDYHHLTGTHYCIDEHKDKLTIDEKLGIRYYKLAIPVGLLMLGTGALFEFVIPGTTTADDAARLGLDVANTLPAIVAGCFVGFGQLPLRLIGHIPQSGSGSPFMMLSFLTGGKIAPGAFPNSWSNVYQGCYVWLGPLTLVYIARTYFNDYLQYTPTTVTWSPMRYVVGAIFGMLGAKFSSGCVCGGCMTGTSDFGIEQIVQTVGMFAGGIPFAFLLQSFGLLN